MPEDDGTRVVVPVEQHLQFAAHSSQAGYRHGDVLQQSGSPPGPVAGHLGVQALAQGPHLGAPPGVLGEFGIGVEIEFTESAGALLGPGGQFLGGIPLVLHQQGGLAVHRHIPGQHRGGLGPHGDDRGRVDQLDHIRAAFHQHRERIGGGIQ